MKILLINVDSPWNMAIRKLYTYYTQQGHEVEMRDLGLRYYPHKRHVKVDASGFDRVIVSNNVLNATSPVVEVVYLTTRPKKDMPTHAAVNATSVPSTALCEHIDHVDKGRLDNWLGVCSEEEMADIDKALLCSLGIETPQAEPDATLQKHLIEAVEQLERLKAERDRYAKMVDHLLGARA